MNISIISLPLLFSYTIICYFSFLILGHPQLLWWRVNIPKKQIDYFIYRQIKKKTDE